jgi:hypothetical protein
MAFAPAEAFTPERRAAQTIDWATPADVIAPLQDRILALFGAGPKGSTGPI